MTKKKDPKPIAPDAEKTIAEVSKELAPHKNSASLALAEVEKFEITNNENYEFAVESIAEFKELASKIETQRRAWVDPLNGVIQSINATFKAPINSLVRAEAILKAKIVAFVNEQAVARDELITQAADASFDGKHKRANVLLEKAEERVVPRISGVQMRTIWTGRVVDANKIPREYMIPDEKALLAATRDKGGDPKIPGWEAYPETSASITAGAVLTRDRSGKS